MTINWRGLFRLATFLYRTIVREKIPIRRGGFGEILKFRRKMLELWEFSDFHEPPPFSFAQLVICFLVAILSLGRYPAEESTDGDPRK